MFGSFKTRLAAVAIGCLAALPSVQAAPVEFTISSVAFIPGSGYGTDGNENGGKLLDVAFSNQLFQKQDFWLDVNQSLSFVFGTVAFNETDAGNGDNAGISENESKSTGLGVTASFSFINPVGTTQNVLATGTAVRGPINDPDVDYSLHWNPLIVDFGTGNRFSIGLDDLAFTSNGTLVEYATIKLLPQLETTAGRFAQTVPEPASSALFGLGLAGLAWVRRKRTV